MIAKAGGGDGATQTHCGQRVLDRLGGPGVHERAAAGNDAQAGARAEVHTQLHQVPVDAVALVPHRLTAIIARDRSFKAMQIKQPAGAARLS
jgi:hypothetical protein